MKTTDFYVLTFKTAVTEIKDLELAYFQIIRSIYRRRIKFIQHLKVKATHSEFF